MITKKLKEQTGLTLAEMLVTVIIVVLVSSCVMLGVDLSRRTFTDSVMVSRAETLSETINQLVSDELRYAEDVVLDGSGRLTSYTSITRGTNAVILQNEGKVYIRTQQDGKTILANILGTSAYPDGVTIEDLGVTYTANATHGGFFTVSYEVRSGSGSIETIALQVKPLSPVAH